MTEQQEFINFFKTNPESEQAEQILNKNNNMKNTKINKVAAIETPVVIKATRAKKTKVVTSIGGLKIEKNIAMPPAGRAASEFTQLAKTMTIGDSVVVEALPKSLYQMGKKIGYKFSNRKLENGSVRIWRSA